MFLSSDEAWGLCGPWPPPPEKKIKIKIVVKENFALQI
jgi:hypothetical protein